MFIMTTKLSKSKLIAIGLGIVLVVTALVLLASGGGDQIQDPQQVRVENNGDRAAFLAQFGWNVNAEPVQTQRVMIPADQTDPVFVRYNELQKSQGYDLTAYAGKEVMRYVYEILNYPDATAPVHASILVYDQIVIGGDVTCTGEGEPIHGFAMPSGQQS